MCRNVMVPFSSSVLLFPSFNLKATRDLHLSATTVPFLYYSLLTFSAVRRIMIYYCNESLIVLTNVPAIRIRIKHILLLIAKTDYLLRILVVFYQDAQLKAHM